MSQPRFFHFHGDSLVERESLPKPVSIFKGDYIYIYDATDKSGHWGLIATGQGKEQKLIWAHYPDDKVPPKYRAQILLLL